MNETLAEQIAAHTWRGYVHLQEIYDWRYPYAKEAIDRWLMDCERVLQERS